MSTRYIARLTDRDLAVDSPSLQEAVAAVEALTELEAKTSTLQQGAHEWFVMWDPHGVASMQTTTVDPIATIHAVEVPDPPEGWQQRVIDAIKADA